MQKLWIRHGPDTRTDAVITAVGSIVRLVVAMFGTVFIVASVSVGMQSTSGVGALWFFVAGMAAVVAWTVWDVVKGWGAIPAARVVVANGGIAFSTPLWQRTFTATSLAAGRPVELTIREHPIIPAGKTMHVYEFSQGDETVRYFAPEAMKDRSMAELRRALAAAGSSLTVRHGSRAGGRGTSRAARNLDA